MKTALRDQGRRGADEVTSMIDRGMEPEPAVM